MYLISWCVLSVVFFGVENDKFNPLNLPFDTWPVFVPFGAE